MQLGLYRRTLAAARLSSLFKFSGIGEMINRDMSSRPETNPVNCCNNSTDSEQQLCNNTSRVAFEEEFASLSSSISSFPKSKRRTRVDLASPREQKSEMELEASTSISQQMDTSLPTSFGKECVPPSGNPKIQKNYHEQFGDAKRSSKLSPCANMDEPFDICLSETYREKWIAEVQSIEENVKHEDGVEKSDNIHSVAEIGQVLRPGMVLFKNYIPLSEQVDIVNKCRELGCGPGGFYRPGYNNGAKLRLYMMCLGLDWNPQTKTYEERRQHDNVASPDIPHEFITLVSRVLDDSHTLIKRDSKTVNAEDILPAVSPDVCIVNFYTTNGRLGLHQDNDESPESLLKGFPVVSISVGDSAEFLYGDQRDIDKAEHVLLESGDVLIFGGESRHIFHGVKTITANTAPPALLEHTKLRPGRLNLTFRKY